MEPNTALPEGHPAAGTIRLLAAAALAALAGTASAQAAGNELEPVVVSASRQQQRLFDTPAGIDAVDVEALRAGRPLMSLSEALLTVPGLTVRERYNYSQDLQLSIRGFGSRATFGVRGVRLLVDGIPASMPDGQGQSSTAQLRSAERIEVLRGPVAQLYGNAAGGVVSVFTADPPAVDAGVRTELSAGLGADGQRQLGARATLGDRRLGAVIGLSSDETDGFRPHSAMRRHQLNAKAVAQPAEGLKLTAVLNSLNLKTQDPLGLTRDQFTANPDQTTPEATTYNTNKPVEQHQLGLVAEFRPNERDVLSTRVYAGHRMLRQTLSIPPNPAPVIGGSGGVVDLDRQYGGIGLQWSRRGQWGDGLPWRTTLGFDADRQTDERLGFDNAGGGTSGTLRRDETNRAGNNDAYAQLEWDATERLTLTGGLRASRVKLSVSDRYVVGSNLDDSGSALHEQVNPVLGALWRASETLNVYANLGRGFETPTLTEVAYRPGGASGLNLGLNAARSRQLELGLRGRHGGGQWQAAWFQSRTQQEIVPAETRNGRSSFQNVDGVERRGIELGWQRPLGNWQLGLGYTWLDASFGQAFTRTVNGTPTTVAAGNRLPGVPEHNLGADLAWRFAPGLTLGTELRAESRVAVDDRNSDFAAGYAVANLRLTGDTRLGERALQWFLRLDNAFDRRYAGSVIVNDGNGRFFEPAPGRRWFAGVSVKL